MRAMLLLLLAIPLFGWQESPASPAKENEATFRTGVSVVRVDAQVADGKKAVSSLGKDDFRVLDNGAEVPVQYFGHDAEPLWLLLLLDISGSMKPRLREMSDVASQALATLGPEDQVAVMFFGRRTWLAQEFTQSRDDAAGAVGLQPRETLVGAGTAINPCILEAVAYLRKQAEGKPGRRAIVILTDNNGLNYQLTNEAVIAELTAADTVLNAIVTPDARPPKPEKPGTYTNPDFTPSDVFGLAKETAGEVLKSDKTGESFKDMLERIRTRYSLHYAAPGGHPGERRQIRVELTAAARKKFPKAEVRARSSYEVPK